MKKLNAKERNEVVTKGFLEDQNFVTKDYLHDTFSYYIDFLLTEIDERFKSFENRIDDKLSNINSILEMHNEWLSNHEDRFKIVEKRI